MSTADFLTIDAFAKPPRGRLRGRREMRQLVAAGIPGLRAATVNHANKGTHSLAPGLIPGGCALVAAWDCPEAAEAAFGGPLRSRIDVPDRFSMDGEIVRVRFDAQTEVEAWHGWETALGGDRAADEG